MEILFCYTERTACFVLMVLFADPKYSNMTCHTSCSGGSEKKMFLDKKGFCSPESGSVVVLQGTQEITVVFKDFCSGCTTIVVTVKTIFRIREENYF
jgi:hypothetical protein